MRAVERRGVAGLDLTSEPAPKHRGSRNCLTSQPLRGEGAYAWGVCRRRAYAVGRFGSRASGGGPAGARGAEPSRATATNTLHLGLNLDGLSTKIGYELCHGLITSIPQPPKSPTFLVAIAAPREQAIAAIWQSSWWIGRPGSMCARTPT